MERVKIFQANKIDLRKEIECITTNEGESAVKKLQEKFNVKDTVKFLETSAKTGENVDLAFTKITSMFLAMHDISFD